MQRVPTHLGFPLLTEMMQDNRERVAKTSEVMFGELNTEIASTPYEIVYQEDRVKVKHYAPRPGIERRVETPLLVVYALINRETMLDLQPGRSVVETFLDSGMDVYMIDWGYPTRKDRYLTIDDHVNGYIDNVVEFIRKKTGQPKINLMGICMGGTFCTMYSALHPQKIKNLVTTVCPTYFDTDEGLLHVWTKNLDPGRMVDMFGNIPADMMNFGFLLLNPAKLMIEKYDSYFENMGNRSFVENFIRMEKWIFDSPDVPGETFRQFIEDCYQKNLLIQNKMEIGGRRIDLSHITMPVLNIYGELDHLVPPGACDKLTGKVGSRDTEDVCLKTGHIGIYVSSKCQKQFAPKIIDWLSKRDGNPNETKRDLAKAA